MGAAVYDAVLGAADRAGLAERRRRLAAAARGRVLEVGAGTGRNLPYYRGVEGVWAVEPDPALRARLRERARAAAVPVHVVEATIEDADLPAAGFDTAVCTLVLCSVADQGAALGRVRRLLRDDGRLLFLEHVRAGGLRGRAQQALTPGWARLAGGCHLDRQTTVAMREAGFVITDCERLRTSPVDLLAGTLIQGSARPQTRAGA